MATHISRKRVVLLFLGGATIDERHRFGDTVVEEADVQPWLQRMSEMDIIAELTGVFIASGETPISTTEWAAAGKVIQAHYDQADGFVIVHQLETLPVAATAFSLMLQKLGKPVVLCGSPLKSPVERVHDLVSQTASMREYGVKANFINALQVAVSDLADVVVVAGSHIYRGRTVTGLMRELRGELIGKIDFGIRFYGHIPHRTNRRLLVRSVFDPHVAVLEYLPGVDLQQQLTITRATRAIFLSIPDETIALAHSTAAVRSRFSHSLPIFLYATHTSHAPAGCILVAGPSRAAALIRVMWALGQTKNPKQFSRYLRL